MKALFVIIAIFIFQQFLFSQPIINSFSPASGPIGTSVTIIGNGFSTSIGNNIVFFGAVRGTVTASSTTSMSVTVPAGTTYQLISVSVSGLIGYSRLPFIVTFQGGGLLTPSSYSAETYYSTGSNESFHTISKDLNNDGKPDVIASNLVIGGNNIYSLSVSKNNSTPGNISLAPYVNYAALVSSYYLASEDIDGDGKPDIIAPHYSDFTPSVSIYKNTSAGGAISLAAPVDVATSSAYGLAGSYGIAVGDLDGDGLPDIVTTNNDYSGKISINRNTTFGGIISFASNITFSTGSDPRAVTTGYINGDNKLDLIVANQAGPSISILTNSSTPGNISFGGRIDLSTTPGSYPEQVAVGDLDGDGKADLVVANNNSNSVGTISIFRNIATGNTVAFDPRIDLTEEANRGPYTVSISDIDGDGLVDIVIGNQLSNAVSVYRNISTPGSIAFQSKIDYFIAQPERSLEVCDLDGDGKPDFISPHGNLSILSFLRNKVGTPGISSFSPTSACSGTLITLTGNNFIGVTSVSFGGVAATSFTVVSNTTITATLGIGSTGSISVINPAGTGTIAGFTYTGLCIQPPKITTFTPSNGPVGTTVTLKGMNFNTVATNNTVYFGSVKAIVSSSTDTSIAILVPPGATNKPITVTNNNLTAYSSQPFNVTFNGDDACDILISQSFISKQDFITGAGPYNAIIVDVDGDGKSDIAVANASSNSISLIKNISTAGNIAFSSHADTTTGTQPVCISYGDLDGDGKQDLAVVNYASNTISVFRNISNTGAFTYTSKIDFQCGSNPRGVYIYDIDLDGKPDIIVTNFSGNSVSVLRNTSQGAGTISFDTQLLFPTGQGPSGIYVLDLDADGKPDLALVNAQSNTVSVLKNITTGPGNISFNPKVDFTTGVQPTGVYISDLDGDGKPDMVISNNSSSTISVFKNTGTSGTISFAAKQDFPTGSGPFSLVITDINGDNKPDVTTANVFDGTVSILKNISIPGVINFGNKMDYITGSNPRSVSIGDIDGDGKPDIITANNSDNTISVLRNQIGMSGQVCSGGSGTIGSSLQGSIYQWQVNSGSGFVNISNNANYSGTNTNTLIINAIPSSWAGYQYRCVVDGFFSDIVSLSISNRFLGSYSSVWENPANWSCGQIPNPNTDVIINCNGVVNINSNAVCRSLTEKPGSSVLVSTGNSLTISH